MRLALWSDAVRRLLSGGSAYITQHAEKGDEVQVQEVDMATERPNGAPIVMKVTHVVKCGSRRLFKAVRDSECPE